MKKLPILLAGLFLLTSLLCCSFKSKKIAPIMDSFNVNDYEQAWKTIDSLESQRLPKSALEKVNLLLTKAREDINPAQTVKCLLYRSKYQSQLEEYGSGNAIIRLEEELKKASFPVDAVLNSILGEAYNQYLQNQRWKIQDRTNTVSFDNKDLKTWTIDQFAQKSMELYQKSVSNPRLRQVSITDFNAITKDGQESDKLRPSLFDFLAHRAIDYFTNEQSYLTQPAFRFYLDDLAIFDPAAVFAKKTFETKDSSSGKYNALILLQELIERHVEDEDPAALIDADLKRLSFAKGHSIVGDKNTIYYEALKTLKNKYAADPASAEIMNLMAQHHRDLGGQFDPSSGDEKHRFENKKAIDLYKEAISKFPKSYGGQQAQRLKSQLESKSLNVTAELVNVPNQPFLLKLDVQNVNKVWFRIAVISKEQKQKIQRSDQSEISKLLRKLDPVKNWQTEWPSTEDYQNHSIEAKAEGLPLGSYVLIASTDADFKYDNNMLAYTFTNVSDIAYWWQQGERGSSGGQYVVVDRTTGAPMADVKATFFKGEYNREKRMQIFNKVGSKISDANGIIRPEASKRNNLKVVFQKGKDELDLDDHFSNYPNNRNLNKYQHTEFFLDRKIYRPGQTVFFKALALEKDEERMPRILTNEPIVVTFLDANRQEVDSKKMQTNAFGTVHGSFTAPKSGLLGSMRIQSSVGSQSVSFRVEEYKRPKFEVKINPLEGSYKLEDELKVTGLAKAFAGSVIDGAKVSYRVVRNVSYPYFPWWRYGYYFRPHRGQSEEIAFGETTTKTDGTFEIPFQAKADRTAKKEDQPVFTYTISADVVDITGETHSSSGSVTIGYVALKADVLLGTQMERDSFKQIKITAKNFSGQDEAAKGKVVIKSLQSPKRPYIKRYWSQTDLWLLTEKEHQSDFEQYAYKGADKIANWKENEIVGTLDFNTADAKTIDVKALNLPAGAYFLELTTADKYGVPIVVRKYFKLFDLEDQALPFDDMQFHYTAKSKYEPGETANYYIGSAAKPIYVFHQIEHKEKIQKEEWIQANSLKKLTLNIEEKHRGNLHYYLHFVKDNRFYQRAETIQVPFSNKELTVEMSTFRDKLYPGQDEEWQIKISGAQKDKVAAEMVATMYDASLDVFQSNVFNNSFYPTFGRRTYVSTSNFRQTHGRVMANWDRPNYPYLNRSYRYLNMFGLRFDDRGQIVNRLYNVSAARTLSNVEPPVAEELAMMSMDTEAVEDVVFADEAATDLKSNTQGNVASKDQDENSGSLDDIAVRTNLNETVFFLPELKTDKDGNIIFSFKMNEALTRWKFLGFAHTKDLQTGTITKEVVTQKDLMVMPNAPRFFREGDEIVYTAKVSNLTEATMNGSAQIALFDAISNQPVNELLGIAKAVQEFTAEPGQSTLLEWRLKIPFGEVMAVTHRVVAKAGNFSDGEESTIPVLTNRMLVTETMPLPVRGKETKDFTFTKLAEAGNSNTLKHHKLTLEFTSNPAWYAVQALPYMMEYPYKCTEQVFSRYYANSLATSVANAHPKVRQVFDKWKGTDAMKSNLSKNQELKSALLEETPWVLAAQSEEQQKQNIGILFDLQRMADEQEQAMTTIEERQSNNGGFSWFPGGRESWYITQYIVEGMGHLDALGVKSIQQNERDRKVVDKAIAFIDGELDHHYKELEKRVKEGKAKWEDDHLGYMVIHYLYARSFFLDRGYNKTSQKVVDYYFGQAKKYWVNKNIYAQGMLALGLHRNKDNTTTEAMIKSFKERALHNDEMGMYFKYGRGYNWYQLPIETHAMMIEVFDEVANDSKAVDDLKVWLLKNKQTNNWKTTKATSAAVYALLSRGANWLLEDAPVQITMGGKKIEVKPSEMEAGTGYFKKDWDGKTLTPSMGTVKVENPNSVVAWGAVYWQYFEDLDKITTFEETPLTLKKQLFKETNTARGPVIEPISSTEVLQPGDKLKVRIELRVDRTMEYVHMKDMRASGFEPINVLSTYKWQDGLGYYESTKDASTNFFFSYLPKGTYVFEYPLRVNHKGDFSNGITTIQSMYAPEFTSHSEGVRVKVD
jgi:uncharacterized protein YfaS (alpha-2-macroglobulin family)